MKLKELINSLHFAEDVTSERFRFRDENYKVFRAKRTEGTLPGVQLSEYFFVEVSETAMELMTGEDDLSYFSDFQTKLLSKPFFAYKNDVRWNLYLILVIDSYEKIKDSSRLHKIENDADYARKFVATPADVWSWLDKEWLHTAAEQAEQADPVQDWNDHLERAQLTGCLTQTFATEHVKQYLHGIPFLSDEPAAAGRRVHNADQYEQQIEQITSVAFDGFRQHCFADVNPIQPTQVNLLHGSNGSGKTSAMEAIELAFTNEIRRSAEFGDKVEATAVQSKVGCQTESGGELIFQSGKSLSLYKQLAKSWYGVTSGKQSVLNYYFHRFNYFDSEAAYRFALSESGHGEHETFDYSDSLSQLVFGEATLATQARWQRYKKEFEDQSKVLHKRKSEMTSEKHTLLEKIADLSRAEPRKPIEIGALLSSIHLRKPPTEIQLEQLENLNVILQSVEPRRKEIVEFPFPGVSLTIGHIETEIKQSQQKLELLMKEKNSKLASIEQLSLEHNRMAGELRSVDERKLSIKQNIDVTNEYVREWQELRRIIEQPSLIVERRALEQRLDQLNHKLAVLHKVEGRFKRLASMTEADWSLLAPESYQQALLDLEETEMLLGQAKSRLEGAEKLMGDLGTLFSRLQHLGTNFLDLKEEATVCPLCKHEHGSNQALSDAIHAAMSANVQGESNADELRNNVEALQEEREQLRRRIEQQTINRQNIEQLAEVYEELLADPALDLDAAMQMPKDQWLVIQQLLTETMGRWQEQQDIAHKELQALDEAGYGQQPIIRAELFQKENPLYKQAQQAAISFDVHAVSRQQALQQEATAAVHEEELLRNQIADLKQRLQQISLEELRTSIKENETQLRHWNRLAESVESLLSEFDLDKRVNLRVWAIQLEKTMTQVGLLIERQRNKQQKLELQAQLANVDRSLEVYQGMEARCEVACTTLNQLAALKDYTEEFINKNISKIERFFKILHTPREFDAIRLEDGGLMLNRKWDGQSVKAYQMSSGQRASLALSVMFAVHLAAPNAPKFMIMDEPVANMDDLHFMNLLDLLRDLALSGRQIFFTTANPDVANLFRRKFSFFEQRFTHFEFTRHSGESVQIRAIKYAPDKESPLSQIS
ncbi:hypothetical protein [Paenibacillus eucommiae]|uniref:Nuclease SbcCD subunit C n=1 Tax=Paenibacillus eucommiae TaxID=1355755 RepID=A0ABS4ISJ7_9BACL|nr:hypothetical protein [Paenibacillus eucommiae]MBP1990559.1 exonuclease SbcC [Paenibacillus eucommiae]